MNENYQANLQANNQSNQAQQAQAKTVINGQEVDVKTAQAAQEAFEKQNNQTGIQAHHDNSTEAVNAGEVAQQSMNQAQATERSNPSKVADLQSGQAHLQAHLQSAGGSQQAQQAKEDQNTIQSAIDAKAKAKTKKAD